MVHGVQPSLPSPGSGGPPPTDPIYQWEKAAYDFIQNNDDSGKSMLFNNVYNDLKAYCDGTKKPFPGDQAVLAELQTNYFSGAGNLDVYASSGLDNADSIQTFMKLFGLPPPAVTQMDQFIMKFHDRPKDSPNSPLFNDVSYQLFQVFGSGGDPAKFKAWAQNELNSDNFKSASQNDQDFFRQFIKT